jgi:two-component system OmpR family response regulator
VRILIVEDQRALAEQLTEALSGAGYAVDCAGDGERADFLAAESYDAVLLLGLPGIDGLTLLRGWRGRRGGAVLVSPPRQLVGTRAGHDTGADDYLRSRTAREVLARVRAFAGTLAAAQSGP